MASAARRCVYFSFQAAAAAAAAALGLVFIEFHEFVLGDG